MVDATEPMYLIRKGGYYYRPNSQGYTVSKDEAGRYTLKEAINITHPNGPDGPRDGMSYELSAAKEGYDSSECATHGESDNLMGMCCMNTKTAQSAELEALRVENDENCRLLGMSAERELALRSELEALRGEVAKLDTKPWAGFNGDIPDFDHPLRCVFESGIDYAVRLLAKELGVDDWSVCDGTEEFDGDLGGTMMNIVSAALPADPQGDPIYPSEINATITQLRARVAALEEAAAKVLPFNVEDGPDYATVYFGDGSTHSTQAMTMNPQDWFDLEAALRALLNHNGEA